MCDKVTLTENLIEIFEILKTIHFQSVGRKLSPNSTRRENPVEKDEGISDEEDPAELRLQLELNEQVFMRKSAPLNLF